MAGSFLHSLFYSPSLSHFYVIVGRYEAASVVLSDGSVLIMGGDGGSRKNDVWKTVDGGASWIPVTSSAGWTAKTLLSI
jgi:hypothetical protein